MTSLFPPAPRGPTIVARRRARPRLEMLEDRRLLAGFAPTISEFALPPAPSAPLSIALGGDGNVYYSNPASNAIGRVTPQGVITEFPLPTNNGGPGDVEAGPDGNIWFVEPTGLGRLTVGGAGAGTINQFSLNLSASSSPAFLDSGPDGNLWFTDTGANLIGRVNTSGVLTGAFSLGQVNVGLNGITAGPDGAMWFLEGNTNAMGRITTGGTITRTNMNLPSGANPFEVYWSGVGGDNFLLFTQNGNDGIGLFDTSQPVGSRFRGTIPTTPGGAPTGLTRTPDGALYFTEGGTNTIGKIAAGTNFTVAFATPTAGSTPLSIVVGSDGNLWFTEGTADKIGRMTTSGQFTEFAVPKRGAFPSAIAAGPDGALWFAQNGSNTIGRISTAGVTTSFPIPTSTNTTQGITAGPDGNLWFTELGGNVVGRITPSGVVSEFSTPGGAASAPGFLTRGADGNLWYTDAGTNSIGRISVGGVISTVPIPTASSTPIGITAGPDGNLWFTESAGNKIGRVTPSGVITEFAIPTANSGPSGIAAGPDGNIWFLESIGDKIGQITPAGVITEYALPTRGVGAVVLTLGPDNNLWYTGNFTSVIGKVVIPPTPNTLTVALAPASDLGASSTDLITGGTTPTFTGTTRPGSVVTVTAQGENFLKTPQAIATATAGADGTWTATANLPLGDDRYQITVRSVAPDGQVATASLTTGAAPLVIATTGPVITNATLNTRTRTIVITFMSPAGLNLATLANPAAYGVAGKGVRKITGVTVAGSGTTVTVTLAFSAARNFSKKVTLLVRARLINDLAGNVLDGEFQNSLPSGDGVPGGFFLVTLPLKVKKGRFFNGGPIKIIINV